jgi:hypothetical protein
MTTVNQRVKTPQGVVVNGVDVGGVMTARINSGYDVIAKSTPDGLALPVKDKECQFVRGTIVTQDWVHAVDLLTGTVGTKVFYERRAGIAETTGYIKHTINKPVIHNVTITLTKEGYAVCSYDFECRAADETKGIADMWALLDGQAKPSYLAAAWGGLRVLTALHAAVPIYHVTAFSFTLTIPLSKACNDGDVGYTCVDADLDAMTAAGSITFQDSTIATAALLAQRLTVAAPAALVLSIRQGQGAASKTLTIANADFNSFDSSGGGLGFTEHTGRFDVANLTGTPLTLAGANKIITIA